MRGIEAGQERDKKEERGGDGRGSPHLPSSGRGNGGGGEGEGKRTTEGAPGYGTQDLFGRSGTRSEWLHPPKYTLDRTLGAGGSEVA